MNTLYAVALFFGAILLIAVALMVSLEFLTNAEGQFTNKAIASAWWVVTAMTSVGAIATCVYGLILMKRLVY